jgi:shikimate dehydrogenase
VTSPDQVDRYAVVGNPVAHSLSPRIHASFATQTGQELSYEAIEIPLDSFANGIRDLQQKGFSGVNVTVPFKREAWELCDHLSTRAQDAGAVNTLSFMPDGNIAGDNTDGVGLTRDLTNNLSVSIAGQKILLLGAGGAVRGTLGPILALAPERLTIANRTPQKAVALARDFDKFGEIQAIAYASLGSASYDLIINGTAAGLSNQVPPVPDSVLGENSVCYDMMYNISSATAFVDWASSRGVKQAFDGRGMLVEQAAEAFHVWRGIRPHTAEIIKSLGHLYTH